MKVPPPSPWLSLAVWADWPSHKYTHTHITDWRLCTRGRPFWFYFLHLRGTRQVWVSTSLVKDTIQAPTTLPPCSASAIRRGGLQGSGVRRGSNAPALGQMPQGWGVFGMVEWGAAVSLLGSNWNPIGMAASMVPAGMSITPYVCVC